MNVVLANLVCPGDGRILFHPLLSWRFSLEADYSGA